MELGNLLAAHAWFKKAEQLGAAKAIVDHDIKSVLARMSKPQRDRVQRFLLKHEPERFAWLRFSRRSAHNGTQMR
jgi:hypothetical protein